MEVDEMTIRQLVTILEAIGSGDLIDEGTPITVQAFTTDPLEPDEFDIEGMQITLDGEGEPQKVVILLGGAK